MRAWQLERLGGSYVIQPRVFALQALPEAMDAAATAASLECVVIKNDQ